MTPQSSSTASPVCSESRHAAQPQPLPLSAVPTLPPAFIPRCFRGSVTSYASHVPTVGKPGLATGRGQCR